ncbi:MAG: nickel-dependent hydrogenase large subunit [Betaproteobacteria bacterium]|nr:nickel-dependent hydrogenase large subunit [Betaproteobacteria bacterium]
MTIEGHLTLSVDWDGKRVTGLAVASTRPFAASRITVGRPAAEAPQIVARLYTVCGKAQRAAAARAVAEAEARDPADALEAEYRVALEAAQEHLWRLLVDWPEATDVTPAAEPFGRIYRRLGASAGAARGEWPAVAGELEDFLEQEVLGVSMAAWEQQDERAQLERWTAQAPLAPARALASLLQEADSANAGAVPLMGAVGASDILSRVAPALIADEGFCRAPTWAGEPRETGALARMAHNPLVAHARARRGNLVALRVISRLAELTTLPQRIRELARGRTASPWLQGASPSRGTGIAWVETARGLLIHLAEVDGGMVVRYSVVAPTEWNFHPRGAFAAALDGLRAGTEAELAKRVKRAALSLDPCVPYRIEVRHA